MVIKIRYFASLREQLARSEDELSSAEALTVREVWLRVNPRLSVPASVLVAVNMDYADWEALVHDGDEVAFFPPVTGG